MAIIFEVTTCLLLVAAADLSTATFLACVEHTYEVMLGMRLTRPWFSRLAGSQCDAERRAVAMMGMLALSPGSAGVRACVSVPKI